MKPVTTEKTFGKNPKTGRKWTKQELIEYLKNNQLHFPPSLLVPKRKYKK
jgi:hypothetical protein